MAEPVRETDAMVRRMAPRLLPGLFRFRTVTDPAEAARLAAAARATFHEDEGLSMLLPAAAGEPLALRQITLDVHSALDGVGLTAAVAGALAARGIPANVVAAHHHDHVFVPEAQADAALDALRTLARHGEFQP